MLTLSRHFGETEGLSIAQIATVSAGHWRQSRRDFYDPTGEKARAVKARSAGTCRGLGAYTQPRNGKGDAYRYYKRWRALRPSGLNPRPSLGCRYVAFCAAGCRAED